MTATETMRVVRVTEAQHDALIAACQGRALQHEAATDWSYFDWAALVDVLKAAPVHRRRPPAPKPAPAADPPSAPPFDHEPSFDNTGPGPAHDNDRPPEPPPAELFADAGALMDLIRRSTDPAPNPPPTDTRWATRAGLVLSTRAVQAAALILSIWAVLTASWPIAAGAFVLVVWLILRLAVGRPPPRPQPRAQPRTGGA